FIVEEDGQPQPIKLLSPSADLPISIGVVLDVSKSMQSKIRTAQRAVDRFLSMIHRDDEIFLMTFAMQASLIADFTSNRTRLRSALMTGVNISGGTALYDSLYQALQNIREAEMLVYSVGIKGAAGFDMGTDQLVDNAKPSVRDNTTVDMQVL